MKPPPIAWCPQCGPSTKHDADGCCLACGCVALGGGATKALRALSLRTERNALRRTLRAIAAGYCTTREWCRAGGSRCFVCDARAALAAPRDTSALDAYVMRVAEAVREACLRSVDRRIGHEMAPAAIEMRALDLAAIIKEKS